MNTIHDLKRLNEPSHDVEVVCAGHEQHNGDSRARRPEIIAIKNLRIEYKSREMGSLTKLAVKDLSLSVHAGEVFGFLGPNGAGKTSTMNVLLGEGLKHLPDHPALQFELGRILSHLAKLEEEAGNIPVAINYWDQVKILMPGRESIPQRIKKLREKLAANVSP